MSFFSEQNALPERFLVPEALFAAAYEQTGAKTRARLKLCIARQYAFWGERPAAVREKRRFRQGFCVEEKTSPAALALIVCSGEYAYAECLPAACMPAVAAGAQRIVVCFFAPKQGKGFAEEPRAPGDSDAPVIRPELLTALELAGIEQVLYMDSSILLQEVPALFAASASGRLVFLEGAGADGRVADMLGRSARRLRVPFITLFREEADTPGADAAGAAEGVSKAVACGSGYCTAVDGAHSGVWIWPQLGPEWFLSRALSLTAVASPV